MLTLATNDGSLGGFKAGTKHYIFRGPVCIWVVVLAAALLTAQTAAAEDVRPKAKAKSSAPAKVSGLTQAQKSAEPQSSCGSGCGGADPALSTDGGDGPRWVCPEPVINIDPIWSGGQIECAFFIRNEGKSDLRIRAKGG